MACRKPPSRDQYCGKAKAKKRRHRRRRRKRKSCRPGKVTRNPFFNYLRWFRKKHCGWNMIKVAVEGAKCWCKMSDQNRRKFYVEACKAPKMRRRRGGRGRSRCGGRRHSRKRRRKSRSRSRSSACGSWGRKSRSRRRRRSKGGGGCGSPCLRKRRARKVC